MIALILCVIMIHHVQTSNFVSSKWSFEKKNVAQTSV